MEMESNQIMKPSKKGNILSAIFYILALILLITAFVSLAVCHQNISLQLEQGVPVKGNELTIVNLYLTSCVQYFAFTAAMVFCGKAIRKLMTLKSEAPVHVTPYMLNALEEVIGSDYVEEVEPEEDGTDFEAWGFKKKKE